MGDFLQIIILMIEFFSFLTQTGHQKLCSAVYLYKLKWKKCCLNFYGHVVQCSFSIDESQIKLWAKLS